MRISRSDGKTSMPTVKRGCILEWDFQHGEDEKYDKRGKHLGAFDPKTGKQLKDSIKTGG